ncbi:MAG: OsmC family protein [Calditrichaeota bacterium]|nr:OsmC family protein [Calditrichota bacterium]
MKIHIEGKVSLIEGMHFTGKNKDGHTTEMDSRPANVTTAGPTPMELLLQSLAGCTGMDVVFILRKRRLEVEKFEIVVEGIKREEHPQVYEEISLVYRAKGTGITLKVLEKAVSLSQDKYCSISSMLKNSVKLDWKCEIIE